MVFLCISTVLNEIQYFFKYFACVFAPFYGMSKFFFVLRVIDSLYLYKAHVSTMINAQLLFDLFGSVQSFD